MTTRDDFPDEEWRLIRKALHQPGAAVILASPGSALTELLAVARAVLDAESQFGHSSFIKSLLRSGRETAEPLPAAKTGRPGNYMAEMIANLRSAKSLVEARATPQEAEDFKKLVLFLAERVAKSVRTASQDVSADEQRVLDEIRVALSRTR